MKQIKLNKGHLELPDCWEDLNFKQKLVAFEILLCIMAGDSTLQPHTALINLLIKFTGYRPSRKYAANREIINFNLLRLAEQIKFIFTIDEEEHKIIPQYKFKTNPFPCIKIGRKKFVGKRFELDITAKTDITAREFVDCSDLLVLMNKMQSEEDKQECMNQLCAILYPCTDNYIQNMVSGHNKTMQQLNPVIKFGIVYWFTGIVKFYTEHEIYSLLFSRNKSDAGNDEKVHLSNEILLMLQREGYGTPEKMTVTDYFDAQIKHLKDVIGKALGEGLDVIKISEKTGINSLIINKLS